MLWTGLGDAGGGGGAWPLVGVCPVGEGARRLLRELCLCGKSGPGSVLAPLAAPLAVRYGGGAKELGAEFPPEVGGRRALLGDGGGLEGRGGVGGSGFSLL